LFKIKINSEKTKSNLISSISQLIIEILEENKAKKVKTAKNDFNSKSPPSISIDAYIDRIVKYTKIESSTLIIGLIYLDRVSDLSQLELTYNNIHRLFFVSILMSIKYNEDDIYSNEFYAKVAGIQMVELNKIERVFIGMMNFILFVDRQLYDAYKENLQKYIKLE